MASKYHSASLTEEQGGVEDDDSESSWDIYWLLFRKLEKYCH